MIMDLPRYCSFPRADNATLCYQFLGKYFFLFCNLLVFELTICEMWKIFEYEYIYTHIYVSCGSNLCVTKPAVIFRMSSFRNIALTNVNFSLGMPSASFFSPILRK